jgi:hypothetical protein
MFAAIRIAAQTPAPADSSFHVSVNLVQVDAEVTDSKGNHVRDLRAGDFEILEDGKPQKITNFSWVDVTPPAVVTESAKTLRKDDVRRSMVLMLDNAGMSTADLDKIRGDINRFVDGQIQPGDLVAVTASRGGMGFYSRFTSDKRQMHDAIVHLAERHGWLICDLITGPTTPAECEAPGSGRLSDVGDSGTTGYAGAEGSRAVLAFVRGATSADRARESRGCGHLCDRYRGRGTGGRTIPSNAPYRLLAKDTGGLFLLSAPGKSLSEDLGKVIEDLSGYYLIGYQPDRKDFEAAQGRPAHHDIQVKVRRKGLTVRARNGFLGVPIPGLRRLSC